MKFRTHTLGYPRIGAQRELKKALEAYWHGELGAEQLHAEAARIRRENWLTQKAAGIDLIPSNDFSYYDQVLDTTCLLGNIPPRFREQLPADLPALDLLFYLARGRSAQTATASNAAVVAAEPDANGCNCCCGTQGGGAHGNGDNSSGGETTASASPAATGGIPACEMTKWFDTNYHYIVPEFDAQTTFSLSSNKIFDEFSEALALGIRTKPVLLGPVSYLLLGKSRSDGNGKASVQPLDLLEKLLPVYEQILERLTALGAEWVQLDEPVLSLDLSKAEQTVLEQTYQRFASLRSSGRVPQILLATYFGPLLDNLQTALALPVQALHVDAVRGREEIDALLDAFAAQSAAAAQSAKILSLGLIDGRNIWRNDLDDSLALIHQATSKLSQAGSAQELWLSTSCSLLHVPISLKLETRLDPELRSWLAFAEEKLAELSALSRLAAHPSAAQAVQADPWLGQSLEIARDAAASRRNSARIHNAQVKARLAALTAADSRRDTPFKERIRLQQEKLGLPLFPTTTIGSFPQSKEVRAARARFRKGEWSSQRYEEFLEAETLSCIRAQEEIGIDVLVHGEFERTDMVEYFGEHLDGFAFTRNGWVQSYGSRCVKPPVIFGDVRRPAPMTVRWSAFAKAQTSRPMKGMLTGPVTILQWSFVRNDQPRSVTTRQIALAIRDEVVDLEQAGIPIIQIDEPALREGLPLRRRDWDEYLAWATESFRISASGVRDTTQIHTHMCYSEFNDIIGAIAALDADCISIETARSDMELLSAFETFNYPNEIGPGVWDIHSPRVPPAEEMAALLRKAAKVLPAENLWANPDCGLKTRGWPETLASLRNLVQAASRVRAEFAAELSV